jgi:hypothetical protein
MAEESEVQILERHLGVVWDKVSLCREVMLESPGIKEDELLNSIIGFLEACRLYIIRAIVVTSRLIQLQ